MVLDVQLYSVSNTFITSNTSTNRSRKNDKPTRNVCVCSTSLKHIIWKRTKKWYMCCRLEAKCISVYGYIGSFPASVTLSLTLPLPTHIYTYFNLSPAATNVTFRCSWIVWYMVDRNTPGAARIPYNQHMEHTILSIEMCRHPLWISVDIDDNLSAQILR